MPLDFWMVGLVLFLTAVCFLYIRGLEELP
jgi:hypothetical protein